MTHITQLMDIRGFLTKHLTDVFETMLSMQVQPVAGTRMPDFSEHVTGTVGVGGDNINGGVYLHLSAKFAQQITCAMLGLPPEETPGDTEVNDVIGELTNMLAGGLKSALCDAGAPCAVSTPAIIRGAEFEIEAIPDVRRDMLLFKCGENAVAVEVHIKTN